MKRGVYKHTNKVIEIVQEGPRANIKVTSSSCRERKVVTSFRSWASKWGLMQLNW